MPSSGFAILDDVHRDVVPVTPRALLRAARGHGGARRRKDQPLEQRRRLRAGVVGALSRVLPQDGMDLIPQLIVDDGLMLAGKALPLWTASPR